MVVVRWCVAAAAKLAPPPHNVVFPPWWSIRSGGPIQNTIATVPFTDALCYSQCIQLLLYTTFFPPCSKLKNPTQNRPCLLCEPYNSHSCKRSNVIISILWEIFEECSTWRHFLKHNSTTYQYSISNISELGILLKCSSNSLDQKCISFSMKHLTKVNTGWSLASLYLWKENRKHMQDLWRAGTFDWRSTAR